MTTNRAALCAGHRCPAAFIRHAVWSDGGTYWNLFNVEGESAQTSQFVT